MNVSLSAAAAVTYSKDGERAPHEAALSSEQEATEGSRKDKQEPKSDGDPLKTCSNPTGELPRRNFHIPRKKKERQALFQYLPSESREFEDIKRILSSSYLQSSSAGTFVYTKAQLVQNELLEKDFAEKRREMKQNGRTDSELLESYGFLLSESYKLQGICGKGLLVGHARTTTLGDPAKGVYLCRYSDLLQINPFSVGATGEIIIFKVLKGKVKTVNISKNVLDPTPNFDCHVSTNAYKVTSGLSYRAFELTQQYFYEYLFDELRERPRHVCPYAVVSFCYKGNTALPTSKPMAPLRSHSSSRRSKGLRRKSSYTVWSGQLLNQGKVVCQVAIHSSTQLFLPFKLEQEVEIRKAMKLDDVKQKIPIALLSWDTYRETGKGSQNGLHGSLFEMIDVSKQNSLSSLLSMLEKEKMVLVKPLVDKGFLFLLSSSQMSTSEDVGRGWTQSLLALFVFREPRGVTKSSLKRTMTMEGPGPESRDPITPHLKTFLTALHYIFPTVLAKPSVDLGAEVEHEARAYLKGYCNKRHQDFHLAEYKLNYDENQVYSHSKLTHNMERYLCSYLYCPKVYQMAVAVAREIADVPPPPICGTSIVDGLGSEAKSHTTLSARTQLCQSMADQGQIEELLKLIHWHKRDVAEEDGEWNLDGDSGDRKRKAEDEAVGLVKRNTCMDVERRERRGGENPDFLSAVMGCMGDHDTDLRQQEAQSAPVTSTQAMLTMLLATLQQTMAQHSEASYSSDDSGEHPELGDAETLSDALNLGLSVRCDTDLRKWRVTQDPGDPGRSDSLEEQACSSLSSLDEFSPSSSKLQHGSDLAEVPWRLIPITGLKPCKYSPRDEVSSLDPRFLDISRSSKWNAIPKTGDSVHMDTHAGASTLLNKECDLAESLWTEQPKSMEISPTVDTKKLNISSPTEPKGADINPPAELKGVDTISSVELKDVESICKNHLKELETIPNKQPERADEVVFQGPSIVDTVFSEELSNFSTDMQNLLKGEQVEYHSEIALSFPQDLQWQHEVVFSEYVSHYTHSVPVHSYISTLRDGMSHLINCPSDHWENATISVPPSSPIHDHTLLPAHSLAQPLPFPGESLASTAGTSLPAIQQFHSLPEEAVTPGLYSRPLTCTSELHSSVVDNTGHSPLGTVIPAPRPVSSSTSISSVISQIRPEVFSTLMEIIKDVQKNTVKFYVHSMEENSVCTEIKDYLIRLGNAECKPHVFVESKNSLDKLLIIIQNKDIAAHIHTIPSLLSLKKLSSVSFAGVDSLEDVKNRTYNELFVSGGFVVSDEFVLDPNFITQNRLQLFLTFLEEKNCADTHWCWKVHCKTHKKLKELARVNSEAFGLLNLLSIYQRKHVVEFLPYHDCDSRTKPAPDLECLIRLQAQNVQYRHIIFLTEQHFEMFPHHSKHGIMIASIGDIMDSLPGLASSGGGTLEESDANSGCPLAPSKAEKGKGNEKYMSLNFGEASSHTRNRTTAPPEKGTDLLVPQPPSYPTEPFQLPHMDQPTTELELLSSETPEQFIALKQVISKFKDSQQLNRQSQGSELSETFPHGRKLESYQSFCPGSTWPVQSPPAAEFQSSMTPPSISPSLSHQATQDSYHLTLRSSEHLDTMQLKDKVWKSLCQGPCEGPSPASLNFGSHEVGDTSSFGSRDISAPFPMPDAHSMGMAALQEGRDVQGAKLPSVACASVGVNNGQLPLYRWGLQQVSAGEQPRLLDFTQSHFSWIPGYTSQGNWYTSW